MLRMVQRGEDFGFALEARQPIRVRRDRRGQDLDRDAPFQLGVGRPIHLAHAAGADLGGDFIRAEASAGSQRQTAVNYSVSRVARGRDYSCIDAVAANLE